MGLLLLMTILRNRFTDYFTHTARAVLHTVCETPAMTVEVPAGDGGALSASDDKRAVDVPERQVDGTAVCE